MILKALLVAFVAIISYGSTYFLSNCMINRPLVVSALVGLFLGHPIEGVMMGASLELAFLGVIAVGGAIPADATMGSLLGTAFAILLGKDTSVALALAVPISLLSLLLSQLIMMISALLMEKVEKYAEEGNEKGIVTIHIGLGIVAILFSAIVAFLSVWLGADAMGKVISAVPKIIMDSLTLFAGMLPAIGFALLLNMLWSKKYAVFGLFGFVLSIYLHLDMIAIAAIAIVFAVLIANRELEMHKITTTSVIHKDEEDFFNV
jgi:mannose/fructose/N-acetylgalactosamine-specific phosphotransferase system component IIC